MAITSLIYKLVILSALSISLVIYFIFVTYKNGRFASHIIKVDREKIFDKNTLVKDTSFQQFGLEQITMLKRMDKKRPLFNIKMTPWKVLSDNHTMHSEDCRWSMIVAVKSGYDRDKQRDHIRKTWGSNTFLNGVCLHVIFTVANTKTIEEHSQLEKEESIHGDILQIDLEETYPNIGYKALASMQWIGENFPNNWIYSSADDDMLPDLPLYYNDVEYLMNGEKNSSINFTSNDFLALNSANHFPIFCGFWQARTGKPKRYECKWQIDVKTYPYEYYPPFCLGGFYSMSVKHASAIYSVSRWYPYFHLDDVWITGFMRLRLCDLISEEDFTFNKTDFNCGISKLLGDRVIHGA
ncbi:beta-1,3-galactosyltransferase 5-like isoform X1 [Styela clava]